MTSKKRPKISIIIPVYNEQEGIEKFLNKDLLPALKFNQKQTNFEIILINDGSTDNTLKLLQTFAARRRNVKLISLSRNFGKEVALAAGLRYATGDAALLLDSDGQHPPKLINKFIKKWQQGAEVVIGVRDHYESHGTLQKLGSKLFYFLLKKLGNQTTLPGSTDFRLLDRAVIDEYNKFTEHRRITRGLIDWLGFKRATVKYTPASRNAGQPSYSLTKLFHLALDSFTSLSTAPLRIFGYLGAFITIASLLLGLFVIIEQYLLGDPLQIEWSGAAQISIFVTFLVGIILISQAITALYIAHISADTKSRPLYVIDQKSSRRLSNNKKTKQQK